MKLTIEEKVSLLSGGDTWHTREIPEKVPAIMCSDGPHGLRKQVGYTDNLGVGESVPAVCFPTASALACSFDRDLVREVGHAIGEECVEEEISVVLGPGISQKRSPLCGRNFEYFSEDPVVSGQLGAAWINGAESTGTGTSLKHFAVNNQEKRRMTISAVLDERTLRETYLRAFQIALENSSPATVMCSYNKINGTYSSENKRLLKDILRDEWGYKGIVVSDWGAVHIRTDGVKAGLNLEMPGNNGLNDRKVLKDYKEGKISEEEIDAVVSENILFAEKYAINSQSKKKYNREKHHALAKRAAAESAVLLKNGPEKIFPMDKEKKTLFVGEFFEKPRFQGAGSSKINPLKVDIPLEVFREKGWNFDYAKGFEVTASRKGNRRGDKSLSLLEECLEKAKDVDQIVIFAGLPEGFESEGFDRNDMNIPEQQNVLIEKILEINPNVAVVLMGGAPMEIPWADKVRGILLMYLSGEAMAGAAEEILSGKTSPSGKLAETWPMTVSDNPSYNYFPGGVKNVEYREGIYVGYKYYDTFKVPVRYPFGHGLSYTDFEYSDFKVEFIPGKSADEGSLNIAGDRKDSENPAAVKDDGLRRNADRNDSDALLKITFRVENKGIHIGKETTFIFSHKDSDNVFFPEKELRDFVKTELLPGQSKVVERYVKVSDLAYYNTEINAFYVKPGKYKIILAASVDDIKGEFEIDIDAPKAPEPDYRKIAPSYFAGSERGFTIPDAEFRNIYGRDIPEDVVNKPFTMENTLEDTKDTLVGKIVLKYADRVSKKAGDIEEGQEDMISAGIREMPFYGLVAAGGDMLPEKTVEALLEMMNGHFFKGIWRLIRKS